jgi:glutamyl-tRNA reductase
VSAAPTISESLISTHQIDDLRMIGLNHRSAAMDLRERLAIGKDELATVLQRLQSETDEVVALSTCNRTELYWVGGTEAPQSLLATLPGADAALLEQAADVVYSGDGLEVVRHVFRLACGLDSMIIGETQILHQMKTAYEFAQDQGSCVSPRRFTRTPG